MAAGCGAIIHGAGDFADRCWLVVIEYKLHMERSPGRLLHPAKCKASQTVGWSASVTRPDGAYARESRHSRRAENSRLALPSIRRAAEPRSGKPIPSNPDHTKNRRLA